MGKRGTHIDKVKRKVASDVLTLLSDVVASLLNLAYKTSEGPNSGRLRMEERRERTSNFGLTAKATHMAVGRTRDIKEHRQTITSTLKLVAIKAARPGLRVHQQLLRRGSARRLQKKHHRGARKHLFPDLLANLGQQKRRGRNKRKRREANRDG
jgi:gamma-glutamyl:cysteine ligase YbdK (ATP-grasp superfamily)